VELAIAVLVHVNMLCYIRRPFMAMHWWLGLKQELAFRSPVDDIKSGCTNPSLQGVHKSVV
jgi:hypothetical protein